MEFHLYRKITPTEARLLGQKDYEVRGGIIQTLHGPATFEPGDYLGRNSKDEWPISCRKMRTSYRVLTAPNVKGWAWYQPLDLRQAAQMSESFTAQGVVGKPGDYLVESGRSELPVDREVFEADYRPVSDSVVEATQLTLYDFGYLSTKSERILQALIALGIPLVDVRKSPHSRRREWDQEALQQQPGLIYYHIGELGNDFYQEARTKKEPAVHIHNPDAGIAALRDIVEQHGKAALMCCCRDRKQCHCQDVGRLAVLTILGLELVHF